MTVNKEPWWKSAVVYQVWPASFKDSNSDGIGDIPGLISKIDYLQDLGVDAVWLSPMYKSPQVDMGYDVADFEAVHEPFGTMADMDVLIAELHRRGMKLILDLVVNHTSDQHAWFKESRSSRDSPKRDWYIWRKPSYDQSGQRQPPNNWRSVFGGSVWEWDEHTEEYYLNYFSPEQPDLNWDNPETRRAIYNSAVRFWLDKGVDGFRVDTVNKYSKPAQFLDAKVRDPSMPWQYAYDMFCNGPRMHEFLKEMHSEAIAPYGDIMTVGELPCTPDPNEVYQYVSAKEKELNMVFHFDMIHLGMGTVRKFLPEPFALRDVKRCLSRWQEFAQGKDMWTTSFAENHDVGRSVSRFASDLPEWRERSAKLLAMMLCTLTGTLYIYQGQELGMVNVPKSWPLEEYKDLETHNFYNKIRKESNNDPIKMREAMDGLAVLARDHARTPVQWDTTEHAGFTDGTPWMKVHPNYKEVNASRQLGEPDSVHRFWKTMLELRRQHSMLGHGDFREYEKNSNSLFMYTKTNSSGDGVTALVVLNFTDQRSEFSIPDDLGAVELRCVLHNVKKDVNTSDNELAPYEGRLYISTSS